MLSVDPPLLLQRQLALKVQQQVGRWHGAAAEEVVGHPAVFKVVGCALVGEDVDEELASRLEGTGYLGHEQLVVLHMLE